MAAFRGIDSVRLVLGIFFILKVIRQLVRAVGHSVDEPITRTLTCLTALYFFFFMGGITKFESHSFHTFSIHCLYRIDFTSNFSKFNLFPYIAFSNFIIFFFFF